MPQDVPSIMEHLAAAGYQTHGVGNIPQPSQVPAHLHHTAWVGERSIDFLARRDRERPFFL